MSQQILDQRKRDGSCLIDHKQLRLAEFVRLRRMDVLKTERVTVNKLICRYVVGKGGRYEVGGTCMWSVRGRYVVGTWSACGL